MIDLNELAFFAAVAQLGSFTKAAKQLNTPKSTLSRHISQLEKRLNVRLLHRSTRHLTLTEAGKLYYQRCQRVVEEADDAEQLIQNMQAEPSGVLRINAPLAFGTTFFQSLLQDFMARFDKLSIELTMDDHAARFANDDCDVAFHVGPLADSNLVARDIGSARWIFCATEQYLTQNGRPEKPDDLQNHTVIRHPHVPVALQVGNEVKRFELSNKLLINDKEMVRNMTLRHMGIGLIHTLLIEEEIRSAALTPLLLDYPCLEQHVYLVYPGRQQLPSKIIAFVDFVLDRVTPVAPWDLAIAQLTD